MFNTCTLLEEALKALPSHFKLKQIFVFLLFFFGARVWVLILHLWYQNPNGYVAVAILIDCIISLSPFLDVIRISMSTVSFLAQLDSGTLCL